MYVLLGLIGQLSTGLVHHSCSTFEHFACIMYHLLLNRLRVWALLLNLFGALAYTCGYVNVTATLNPDGTLTHEPPLPSGRARGGPASAKKSTGAIQCRDESGHPVPWFIAYKLPKIKSGSAGPTFKSGTGYSYILPTSSKWTPSTKGIGDKNSVVGQTLKPFFKNGAASDPSLFTLVYNDQPAGQKDFGNNAHAKGVLIGGGARAGRAGGGAVWLVHSVPKFPGVPPRKSKARDSEGYYNFYPTTGVKNAQMFLCLTLRSSAQLDELASSVFHLTLPHVNKYTLPEPLKKVYPKLKEFLDIKRFSTKDGPHQKIFPITVGGLKFQLFAKSPHLNQEIYSEWVAPNLKSSLDVQSWLNGVNAFESNCSSPKYPVYNIKDKKLEGFDFARNDHSKWAVGREKKDPWTCVSDLNRMEGQKSRGGSTLCAFNSKLWNAFNSAVIDLQPCPLKRG